MPRGGEEGVRNAGGDDTAEVLLVEALIDLCAMSKDRTQKRHQSNFASWYAAYLVRVSQGAAHGCNV